MRPSHDLVIQGHSDQLLLLSVDSTAAKMGYETIMKTPKRNRNLNRNSVFTQCVQIN